MHTMQPGGEEGAAADRTRTGGIQQTSLDLDSGEASHGLERTCSCPPTIQT